MPHIEEMRRLVAELTQVSLPMSNVLSTIDDACTRAGARRVSTVCTPRCYAVTVDRNASLVQAYLDDIDLPAGIEITISGMPFAEGEPQ
jgi:hypothetical protein